MTTEKLLQRLTKLGQNNALPPSLLLLNSSPSIREDAFIKLCASTFCTQDLQAYCSGCSSCVKVFRNRHPDLRKIETDKKEISIEDVKSLLRWLQIQPHENAPKIAGILNAHKLNASSANALLKILEEPPKHAMLVLGASGINQILPTLRSRLFQVRISGVDSNLDADEPPTWAEALSEVLAKKEKASYRQIFQLSQELAKDKENLPYFFSAVYQAHKSELRRDLPFGRFTHLEHSFQITQRAEHQLLKRYGNTALWLDETLMQWKHAFGEPS